MRYEIFYALVDRNGVISPNPYTAYHVFECEVDSMDSLLDRGIRIGLEVARRVDLTSFRVNQVYCSREPISYRVNRVRHGLKTPCYEPLDFDEALEVIQEQLTPNRERWSSMDRYEMEPLASEIET
jgi:hypothetical protein